MSLHDISIMAYNLDYIMLPVKVKGALKKLCLGMAMFV